MSPPCFRIHEISIFIFAVFVSLSVGVYYPRQRIVDLQDRLLKDYRKDFRPVKNFYKTCYVNLRWHPLSLYSFDEVSGIFTLVSSFVLWWYDEHLKWTPEKYQPSNIAMRRSQIWYPELALYNSADNKYIKENVETETLRVLRHGQIHYNTPAKVQRTLCTPNMKFYPIDEHTCTQEMVVKGYYKNEVRFGRGSKVMLKKFQSSSTWDVMSWKLTFRDEIEPSASVVVLTVKFRRKPIFIMINMITPILLLSVINVFVFGLPVVSGERISYAMTTFLSLAVYMTIIADKLPDGNPVPIFTYFVIGKLVYSALIILCTIIGLQFHHGENSPMVRTIVKMVTALKRKSGKRLSSTFQQWKNRISPKVQKVNVIHVATIGMTDMDENREEIYEGDKKASPDGKPIAESQSLDMIQAGTKITPIHKTPENQKTLLNDTCETRWKNVAKLFDRLCLVFFLMIVVSEIVAWFILTWRV